MSWSPTAKESVDGGGDGEEPTSPLTNDDLTLSPSNDTEDDSDDAENPQQTTLTLKQNDNEDQNKTTTGELDNSQIQSQSEK